VRLLLSIRSMTGEELRRRRLRAGCSRDDVAQAIGVSASTVRAWEDEADRISCPAALEQVLRRFESRRVSSASEPERDRAHA
jgi:DNA-binding transcriptional regulator YiaG